MSEPRIESGQVYREKGERFTRFVVAIQELRDGRWQCGPCREDGRRTFGGRISKIKADNLKTRFELVNPPTVEPKEQK